MPIIHKHLGKRMPGYSTLKEVTAWEFFQNWNTFAQADVWTDDGWLITAACSLDEDGINFLARRECDQKQVNLKHADILNYVPNQQTALRGFK
jgi:hypothetical protein